MSNLLIEPPRKPVSSSNRRPSSRSHVKKVLRRQLPGWTVALIDFLLVGVTVCTFALFHHVIPRKANNPGMEISRPSVSVPDSQTVAPPSSEGASQPDSSQTDLGMFGAKFGDKFSDTVEKTASSYKSRDISVTLTKHVLEEGTKNQVTYFAADIYIRNIDNFRTAFAGGEYGHGYRAETVKLAQENNAVIALSGDYYGIRETGVVIRNGKLYRNAPTDSDVCVLYYDGTMETYSPGEFDVNAAVAKGAYQAWTFGPQLLDDGQVMDTFNTDVRPANPRSAIGYIEPGHYVFVLVDGRQPGYSAGLRFEKLSQIFYDLGCKAAYNLDGGQSAVMAFGGAVANQPAGGGRSISDILYIGEVG